MPDVVQGLNDPARGEFNNTVPETKGNKNEQADDRAKGKYETSHEGKGNNEEEAGYQSRKAHSSKNNDVGDDTTAKQ